MDTQVIAQAARQQSMVSGEIIINYAEQGLKKSLSMTLRLTISYSRETRDLVEMRQKRALKKRTGMKHLLLLKQMKIHI